MLTADLEAVQVPVGNMENFEMLELIDNEDLFLYTVHMPEQGQTFKRFSACSITFCYNFFKWLCLFIYF